MNQVFRTRDLSSFFGGGAEIQVQFRGFARCQSKEEEKRRRVSTSPPQTMKV